MENELLAFEVRFLRAHLGLGAKRSGSSLASSARLTHLEEAERDLVLLLRRMSTSPAGPALRLNRNFRALEGRYLRPSGGPQGARGQQGASLPDRVAYLEGAERDLVLLLKRMGRWPLGRVFRLKGEFRTLEGRYL